jgi:hypothetical protein
MAVMWTSAVVNTIAPGLATFSHAEVPDLTAEFPEAPHWVANYFLNGLFRARYRDRVRQAVLGYLRRVDHAFRAYHEARSDTLEYVSGYQPGRPRAAQYYKAITNWEIFLLQAQMATGLYNQFSSSRAFEQDDGSPEQRLYALANAVKHFCDRIASQRFTSDAILPLWIGAEGLHSFDHSASYVEAAQVLRDLAALANLVQDPRGWPRE